MRTEGQDIRGASKILKSSQETGVRPESQEQRLVAAGERLEKVVAPTLEVGESSHDSHGHMAGKWDSHVEAFRAEMQQLRLADRSEMDQRFEHLSRCGIPARWDIKCPVVTTSSVHAPH